MSSLSSRHALLLYQPLQRCCYINTYNAELLLQKYSCPEFPTFSETWTMWVGNEPLTHRSWKFIFWVERWRTFQKKLSHPLTWLRLYVQSYHRWKYIKTPGLLSLSKEYLLFLGLSFWTMSRGPGAVVKAACLESRRSRVWTPHYLQVFHKYIVSSPLTRNISILWGTAVTER